MCSVGFVYIRQRRPCWKSERQASCKMATFCTNHAPMHLFNPTTGRGSDRRRRNSLEGSSRASSNFKDSLGTPYDFLTRLIYTWTNMDQLVQFRNRTKSLEGMIGCIDDWMLDCGHALEPGCCAFGCNNQQVNPVFWLAQNNSERNGSLSVLSNSI
jgi:hypothetical protein